MPSMRGSSISGESPESVLKITGCTPDGIKRVTKKPDGHVNEDQDAENACIDSPALSVFDRSCAR